LSRSCCSPRPYPHPGTCAVLLALCEASKLMPAAADGGFTASSSSATPKGKDG
jgi:hypothetical protein